MFDVKMKAITFSFDDSIVQDIRLLEILNKYSLKCTFSLNYNRLGLEDSCVCKGRTIYRPKVKAEDVKHIYPGHKVAGHSLNNPSLKDLLKEEVVREVEDDPWHFLTSLNTRT